ncbi:MAG: glycosyltransferase family 1 protein [Patescibacteria group bacterium]
MKILIDARLYGLENTGIGRYTMGLVDSLSKVDKKNQYLLLLREKYYRELKLPKNWKKVLCEIKHYSLSEQIKLPRIIKKYSPYLTHFVHFNVPVSFRGKFVVTIHDLLMHRQKGLEATTLPPYAYLAKRLGYKFVFRNAVLNARKIITPSHAVKNEIISYYKSSQEKLAVIYEGVTPLKIGEDTGKVLSKYALKGNYFIYTGNAYPHKNLERLIRAFMSLNKDSNEKYSLAIVCSRDFFTKKLEKTIGKMKAGESIKLLGFVPDSELGTLYKNALAFVSPSLSEGFGLPGLEAMLAGTPALVSDIAVFREVYKDNSIYFDPYSSSLIEKGLREVISLDPTKREEIIRKGEKFARSYSWDKMGRETLKIYESCARLRSG